MLGSAALRELCKAEFGMRRERVGDQGSGYEGVCMLLCHSFGSAIDVQAICQHCRQELRDSNRRKEYLARVHRQGRQYRNFLQETEANTTDFLPLATMTQTQLQEST